MKIHERLFALAAHSEPDAAHELTACGFVVREMMDALKAVDLMFSEPRKYNKRMIVNRVRELIAKAEGGAA